MNWRTTRVSTARRPEILRPRCSPSRGPRARALRPPGRPQQGPGPPRRRPRRRYRPGRRPAEALSCRPSPTVLGPAPAPQGRPACPRRLHPRAPESATTLRRLLLCCPVHVLSQVLLGPGRASLGPSAPRRRRHLLHLPESRLLSLLATSAAPPARPSAAPRPPRRASPAASRACCPRCRASRRCPGRRPCCSSPWPRRGRVVVVVVVPKKVKETRVVVVVASKADAPHSPQGSDVQRRTRHVMYTELLPTNLNLRKERRAMFFATLGNGWASNLPLAQESSNTTCMNGSSAAPVGDTAHFTMPMMSPTQLDPTCT
mmetsp:Transcript_97448/g.314006  ORF Transcript_97448/g.314006 Transcript_97448/m.314006 type:complete len:316 (+) Transcript_97448:4347-5294(+)